MTATMLDRLQAIDINVLTDVVRQDQRCPDFVIRDWSVGRLSDKGIASPDGLFRFQGNGCSAGQDGPDYQDWSVVFKMVKPTEWEQGPGETWYWKRELLLITSGVLDRLPGPLVTPRFYGVKEMDGEAWIWMEYIEDIAPPRWTDENYIFAAHQLGRMDGAYLTGTPLPDYPWLNITQCRSWFTGFGNAIKDLPNIWENPILQQVYTDENRRRAVQFRADHELFHSALDRLPQVFGHFDAQRRNLMIRRRPDGQQELVAIDWGMAGPGPLGGNLAMMLPNSAFLFELDPVDLPRLEPETYRAYLEGLREMGWQGDEDLVRLGYCAWTWPGIFYPEMVNWDATAETLPGYKALAEFFLDHADEARGIINRLGL